MQVGSHPPLTDPHTPSHSPLTRSSRVQFDALSLPDAGTVEALTLCTQLLARDVLALTAIEQIDDSRILYCETCRATVSVRGGRAYDHARLGHRVTR